MVEQHPLPRRFGWRAFILWSALTVVGYFLAGGFHFPTGFASDTFDPRTVGLGSGLVGFVFGTVSGVIIASLQWIILRSWASNARSWIPLNVMGFGLVHALGDAVPYMPIVLAGGIVIGLAQYLALRRVLTRPILWIPIAAIAWYAGFQLGLTLPHRAEQYNLTIAALTYGVITGLALRFLLVKNLPAPRSLDPFALFRQWPSLNLLQRILVSFLMVLMIAVIVLWTVLMFGLG